jgi:hypothetical protein
MEQGQAKAFEPLYLNYGKCREVKEYVATKLPLQDKVRLEKLMVLLKGFTSDLSLEVLATVDFIIQGNPDFAFTELSAAIGSWNERKKRLFKEEYVKIAYDHLQANRQLFT